MSDHGLKWVKPALQARSQQTLERLLDATEALIEEKGIDRVTVAEIARRASSSVGAFYARFEDKEALLRCVLEHFYEQAAATTEAALHDERWLISPLRATLNTLIRFMIEVLTERRQLIVAMMMRAAGDSSLITLAQRLQHQIGDGVAELLERRGQALDHPDPPAALRMCVWMMLSVVENRLLYATCSTNESSDTDPSDTEHASAADGSPMAWSDTQLAEELTTMSIRYLGMHPSDMQSRDLPLSTNLSQAAGSGAAINLS